MVVGTSDKTTGDAHSQDVEDVTMTAVDESAVSPSTPGEKAVASVTMGTPNSNTDEGVNERDSTDGNRSSPRKKGGNNFPKENSNYESDKESPQADSDSKGDSNSDSSSESDRDSDRDSSGNESSSDSDDSQNDADGISAYERLRIERIRRNEERLAQLGLVDPNKKLLPPKRKKLSFGRPRQQRSKEIEAPMRSQPKRSAKKKLLNGELLAGGQVDLRRSFPLGQSYKDRFGRKIQPKPVVEKNRYTKRYRCGECSACQRQTDCQTCYFCAMNKRQDPTSKVRRRCLFNMCLRRLVDVEVDVESDSEKDTTEKTELEAGTNETSMGAAAGAEKSIDDATTDNNIQNADRSEDAGDRCVVVAQGVGTNVDIKVERECEIRDQNSQSLAIVKQSKDDGVQDSNRDGNVGESSGVVDTETKTDLDAEVQGENGAQQNKKSLDIDVNDESARDTAFSEQNNEVCNEKIPIDNSEYFSSYRMEEDESGLPKWLDEFHQFLVTIPHGPMNRPSGEKNAVHTMSQICKLVSGEGITYHLWPAGIHFKSGIKIHLGMDLKALHEEGIYMERTYKDRRKGSLLRHPIAKLVCYKEWIADGKPRPANEPPIAPLVTLPQPAPETKVPHNDGDSKPKLKKRMVAMAIEDRIKPHRFVWVAEKVEGTSDEAEAAQLSDKNKIAINDSAEERKGDSDAKVINESSNADSGLKKEDNNTDARTDDKENIKGLDGGHKNAEIDTALIAIKSTGSAKNPSGDVVVTATDETGSSDTTNLMPSGCTVCSRGGFLICCDGCNRGFHSNCHWPKIKEIPTGDWFCRDCTRKKKTAYKPKKVGGLKREVVVNHKLFQGEHDDDCYICYLGGELICCDFCEKSFHLACHIPPLPFVPEGLWKCCECSAVERKKMSRCGECKACTRDDCGKCKHCLDKPKFGGLNKLKQTCIKKICPYPRFAPPASSISVAGAICTQVPKNASIASTYSFPNAVKRKRGRPRKSESVNSLPLPPSGKKRGRPRKSESGNNYLVTDGEGDIPRQSVDAENVPTNDTIAKKRGRPRKSVDGESIPINGMIGRKRGRPRKSVGTDDTQKSKRVKIEASDDSVNQPIIFKFKISSFKSVLKDPESIKIRKIIKTAIRDPRDAKAVDKACEHLRRCLKSVESVKTALLFGGVEMICNAMKDHPDKCILQAEACCTLSEMLWVFPDITTKLTHMGVINLIISSINGCPNNSKVQQMGCGALGALSYDENSIQRIIDAGGLQAVIAAMERFPKKIAVQKEGCYFFQNLIVRSIDALTVVSNSRVVPILVDVMSSADSDTEFLVSVCGLIANLAVDRTAKELVGNSEAIPAILSVLNRIKEVEVKCAACTALKNLASGSAANQTTISEKGGLDAVFGAIRSHPNDSFVLILSFSVMKELCMNDEDIAFQIVKHGGIKIILKAMEKHRDLAAMQVSACEIIGYLLLKGKSEIHAPKFVKAIITAMKNHKEASDVQIQACDALYELSQVPTTRLILKKKETQELLLRAKSHFKSCESDVDDIIAAIKK